MKATKRIKIRLEKHELRMIRFEGKQIIFCRNCQAKTQHLTVLETAIAFGTSEMNVFRLIEDSQIHSTETENGRLLICFG